MGISHYAWQESATPKYSAVSRKMSRSSAEHIKCTNKGEKFKNESVAEYCWEWFLQVLQFLEVLTRTTLQSNYCFQHKQTNLVLSSAYLWTQETFYWNSKFSFLLRQELTLPKSHHYLSGFLWSSQKEQVCTTAVPGASRPGQFDQRCKSSLIICIWFPLRRCPLSNHTEINKYQQTAKKPQNNTNPAAGPFCFSPFLETAATRSILQEN